MQLLIRKPGFVNTSPPQKRQSQEAPESRSKPLQEKRTLWARLVEPLLKKRRFHPTLVGILMIVIGVVGMIWLTYGQDMSLVPARIDPATVASNAMSSTTAIILSASVLIGCIMFPYGLIRGFVRTIRRVINVFRKLVTRVLG